MVALHRVATNACMTYLIFRASIKAFSGQGQSKEIPSYGKGLIHRRYIIPCDNVLVPPFLSFLQGLELPAFSSHLLYLLFPLLPAGLLPALANMGLTHSLWRITKSMVSPHCHKPTPLRSLAHILL